ncbi:hypothetical protein ACOSQ4_014957 [Xanthoceras sorbifolium]
MMGLLLLKLGMLWHVLKSQCVVIGGVNTSVNMGHKLTVVCESGGRLDGYAQYCATQDVSMHGTVQRPMQDMHVGSDALKKGWMLELLERERRRARWLLVTLSQ